jgi:hypothetical protein
MQRFVKRIFIVGATEASVALSARAVASLEMQVLGGAFVATVSRDGKLYGTGVGFEATRG